MVKFTIGDKSPLPDLKPNFESKNIKNLFVIGSLSGIPLIKNAIDQGQKVIKYVDIRKNTIKKEAQYDIIIVGAGPAGVTAALEAQKKGFKYLIIEKGRVFEQIHQYPNKKFIYAEPEEMKVTGDLAFKDKEKEPLIEDWNKTLKKTPINSLSQTTVTDINRKNDLFSIKTNKGEFTSKFTILAIGDLGSPRKLNIKGEDQNNVHHKLNNPDNYKDQNVLVVGGGNSAIEAAIALAKHNKVTVSYRQSEFFRCSQKNKQQLQKLVDQKKITTKLKSNLKQIDKNKVTFNNSEENFDNIFILIGFTPPFQFMQKINIKLQKTLGPKDIFGFLIVGFLMLWMYSYNKGVSFITNSLPSSSITNLSQTSIPFTWWTILLYVSLIAGVGYSIYAGIKSIKKIKTKVHTTLISILLVIWILTTIAFSNTFFRTGTLFPTGDAFWPYYTVLYSIVVTAFGFYSILKYKKRYIWNRTLSLMYSQSLLLFILPIFIFKDWRLFWLVYVWPLGPDALTNTYVPDGTILPFLSNAAVTWIGLILAFVVFTVLVYYKGRGAVCSWFCGCGALAETLGDPFRTKTPQGKSAKPLEYSSYLLLGFAGITTILKAFRQSQLFVWIIVSVLTLFFMWFVYKKINNTTIVKSIIAGILIGAVVDFIVITTAGPDSLTVYKWFGDFTLAGWFALTVYFFIGGRIWCRYFCPLIAYLGVISSIGRFKIRPEKDKCISCGLCSRNCHMGIDVMSYAQRGHDMKEPSCVGCGICVEVCPMDLFTVEYDQKTIGPGTSYQIKSNPNKFQILAMGGKPEATKTLLQARAKFMQGLKK